MAANPETEDPPKIVSVLWYFVYGAYRSYLMVPLCFFCSTHWDFDIFSLINTVINTMIKLVS